MNSGDLKGNSPLMYASSWGQLKVVKMLIFLGADSNVVNNDGFSAVDYAYSLVYFFSFLSFSIKSRLIDNVIIFSNDRFAGVKAIDEVSNISLD